MIPKYRLKSFKQGLKMKGKHICDVCGRKEAKFVSKGQLSNSYFCGNKCIKERFMSAFNIKIEKIKKGDKN